MHPNLNAYDGVEDTKLYKSAEDLDRYCDMLLSKSAPQADFISKLVEKKKCRVLEFCSGNSRMLYALDKAGVLKSGTGVEISKSRHTFAEAWRRRLAVDTVKNICGDVLGAFVLNPVADVALMLTGAFQYMQPISPDAPGVALRSLRRSLVSGGLLILELYPHPTLCKSSVVNQIWSELPLGDPWRFYLQRIWYDENSKYLNNRKIFVGHKGQIDDGRMEVLRIYSPSEISDLLDANGFAIEGFYGDWSKGKSNESSDLNIIVGRAV